MLLQKACSGSAAAWEALLLAPHCWWQKTRSLKDRESPTCVGALLLGAPSHGKVPWCTAELGTCTAGVLSGPTVVLLVRTTLKLQTGLSYHRPDPGFMATPSLVARELMGRGAGTVLSSPLLRRGTSGLTRLIPGGAMSG